MNRIQWEISVPIFRNRFIMRGLALSSGIPFGVLILFLVIASGGDIADTDTRYALALIGMLFGLTILLILALYGGKYAPGFIVDNEGIINYTQEKQARKNKAINTLLVVLGLIRGNFTAAGTGLIAHSRQVMKIKWKNVSRIRYYPKQKTILVQGGFTEKIAIFCTKDNYAEVEKIIRDHSLVD
ncbi:MAG: hypothetical protein ACYCYM_13490 [Saccharofermentanales bacterium]